MSRCIMCNKKISKGYYFCDKCLKAEAGKPQRRGKLSILSWLVLLPLQAGTFFPHWTSDDEKLQWVVQAVDKVTTKLPLLPTNLVIGATCIFAGLRGEEAREEVLFKLQRIKADKNVPLWAPWDIVFQPGIQVLVVAAGLLSLFLLALGM